ncbi:Uncharacterized protein BP5553_08264 [Venustampulla echinocandica]|uniref:Phosphatidic acid phosphatase type 2/haloperoxidase domain-containing protein n=1 Tax=Venustampulla echinocandica TaxID=2656787 RepID=A0A370TG65_9HELO|nr:Uncharacterized protein BP5553_08264 [Venustampulla echinocandica]RDL33896.1 Uncharacterized protein BP5553_08264 [Venustampulla echinocandica]
MGIFSRRPRDGAVAPDRHATAASHQKTSHHDHSTRAPLNLDYSRRPTFGHWIRGTWLDVVSMAVMGAIGLGVYMAHPAPTRSFAVTFQDGEVVYPDFAYPMRKNIIPIYAAALLASLVPIFIILCMQVRVRSFWDANNAIIGLLYSLISAAVFQVFLKWLIGGLRPHFLAVCKPNIDLAEVGTGYQQIMYDRSICTGDGDEIDDSLESFPSGHSTAAFAGFVFLYLYLNAKLKTFSNHHPAMWKLIATYAPILGATLIASSLTIDEYHNWYDCLAGAIIGTVFAFSSYRMVYASVWDFRFNHIPLNRTEPFTYGIGQGTLANAVFTRKAGWGVDEGGFGGAPFDASGLAGEIGNGHGFASPHHNGTATGGIIPNGNHRHGHHPTSSIGRRPVGATDATHMV